MDKETEKTFKWCLERKAPGLRKIEPDLSRAKSHLNRARGNLEVMAYLHEGGYHDWVIATGYYAMYHASLAALLVKGIEGKDHNCVVVALRHLYVELVDVEGMENAYLLERKLVENLDKARVARINIQYGVSKIVATDIDWIIPASRDFVNKTEELIHNYQTK
ncbi:MAG: HEPN domain-containing protein [Candidatus Altiarchaeota archaeon]